MDNWVIEGVCRVWGDVVKGLRKRKGMWAFEDGIGDGGSLG